MKKAANELNIKFANEVFSDRTYQDDGSLTPRTNPQAMIEDPQTAIKQAVQMISSGNVISVSGKKVPVKADTVCIHGDSPNARALAVQLSATLKENGILVQSFN